MEGALFHQTINRRQWLERMCGGYGLLGLLGTLNALKAGGGSLRAAPPAAAFRPRAKRAIVLFMNGGPSQVDTFDPKPALKRYQGQQPRGKLYRKTKGSGFMPSPFPFRRRGQSGTPVNETLPHLGSLIDECCVIRSLHTDVPNHEPALLQMHTGNIQPIRPSLGSWLLYGLGTENANLPGYVVLRPSPRIVVGPALWSNSFLPAKFQATSIVTSDLRVEKLLRNIRNPKYTLEQQRQQVDLIRRLDELHLSQPPVDRELEAQIEAMETAFKMQMEATEVLDIRKEPAHVREAYGDSRFAQSCLLARRLVEAGVRFVSVYYTSKSNQPWDTHSNHNAGHKRLCADSDRATAALIRDLKTRGLLEDTLVVWGGEFGRTPYAQNQEKKKVGRDHHHTAFSMLLAGGGVKGGMVYGESDELGMHIVSDPVHVHDLHATILYLMGLDHKKLTYRYSGRDFRLTDVHGRVVHDIVV